MSEYLKDKETSETGWRLRRNQMNTYLKLKIVFRQAILAQARIDMFNESIAFISGIYRIRGRQRENDADSYWFHSNSPENVELTNNRTEFN